MPLREGSKHGAFGLVSVFLAIKFVVVKGLVFLDDLLFHQLLKVPFELLLHELPVSVFGTVGAAVVALTGTALPPPAVGLVVAYPIAVVLVVSAVEGPTPKRVASYWLGTTVVTGFSVAASVGMAPDPAGVGSGLAYHLQHHSVAVAFREGVLALGGAIAAAGGLVGVPIDDTIGLALAAVVVAVGYGAMWELHVGHE
jgi:hypothetical protein